LKLPLNFKNDVKKRGDTLKFITPTRLVFGEKIVKDLTFDILIRQLLRRVSLISYFHCGLDLSDIDFKKS